MRDRDESQEHAGSPVILERRVEPAHRKPPPPWLSPQQFSVQAEGDFWEHRHVITFHFLLYQF